MTEFEYETTEELYDGIEQAMKNGRGPEAFAIGYVDGRIAQTWEEIIQADKNWEIICHVSESDPRLYTDILQILEWQPIETLPKDISTRFLITTKEVQEGVVEVVYDPERNTFEDDEGEIYIDDGFWMPLPTPPRKKE